MIDPLVVFVHGDDCRLPAASAIRGKKTSVRRTFHRIMRSLWLDHDYQTGRSCHDTAVSRRMCFLWPKVSENRFFLRPRLCWDLLWRLSVCAQIHFSLGTTLQPQLPDNGYYRASASYKTILAKHLTSSPLSFPVMIADSMKFVGHYNGGVPRLDLCKSDENGSPFFTGRLAPARSITAGRQSAIQFTVICTGSECSRLAVRSGRHISPVGHTVRLAVPAVEKEAGTSLSHRAFHRPVLLVT